MSIKFAALMSGLIGPVAMALALAVSSPAHAATLSTASPRTQASVHPEYTASVAVTVRCGKFVGKINHGGTGGILNRAYLQVEGQLSSSCNSTTDVQVRYDTGVTTVQAQTIKSVGARKSTEVDWETHSVEGTYGHIGIRVGTTDGMPKGRILWGAWKDV